MLDLGGLEGVELRDFFVLFSSPEKGCLFYQNLIIPWLDMLLAVLWHYKEGGQHGQLA